MSIEGCDELQGARFEDVYFRFDRAIPIGVISSRRGQLLMCPRPDYELQPGDELCLIRASGSAPLAPLADSLRGAGGADEWHPCCDSAAEGLCDVRDTTRRAERLPGTRVARRDRKGSTEVPSVGQSPADSVAAQAVLASRETGVPVRLSLQGPTPDTVVQPLPTQGMKLGKSGALSRACERSL